MKVIFLDIDGVLNPTFHMNALTKMWRASGGEISSMDEFGYLFFDQNVEALKYIIDRTKAYIVISSSWRISGAAEMGNMWHSRKLPGSVIDITPRETEVVESGEAEFYDMVCRGAEIDFWLKRNPVVSSYVIIDDTADMLEKQQSFFVNTKSNYGLTMSDAKKAIKILNSENI